MAIRDLKAHAHDLYGDPALADAVLADAHERGNTDRIIAGEMVLPHPQDAKRWHEGKVGARAKEDEKSALERRIQALEAMLTQPQNGGE